MANEGPEGTFEDEEEVATGLNVDPPDNTAELPPFSPTDETGPTGGEDGGTLGIDGGDQEMEELVMLEREAQEAVTQHMMVEEELCKQEEEGVFVTAIDSHTQGVPRSPANRSSPRLPSLTPNKAHIDRLPSPRPQGRRASNTFGRSQLMSSVSYPNKMIKVSKVSMSARAKISTSHPGNYVEYARRPRKVVTWSEAMSARPPLRIDMEGPTPCSYYPDAKPPSETNAPAWSFGQRTFVEKDGGARTSWQKTWFQTPNVWQQKTDFLRERKWPTPHQYDLQTTLGPYQQTLHGAPSHSMGIRRSANITKKGSAADPSPNDYNREKSETITLKAAPSYSHGLRRGGTYLWASGESLSNPGPGTYEPKSFPTQPHKGAFTIRGIRREKSHVLGPFATF